MSMITERYGNSASKVAKTAVLVCASLYLTYFWFFTLDLSPITLWVVMMVQMGVVQSIAIPGRYGDTAAGCVLWSIACMVVGAFVVWILNIVFDTHLKPIHIVYPLQACCSFIAAMTARI
jgi:hypothetical protein